MYVQIPSECLSDQKVHIEISFSICFYILILISLTLIHVQHESKYNTDISTNKLVSATSSFCP